MRHVAAALMIALGLATCEAPGISRDEAIAVAGKGAASSTTPLVLISATRTPGKNALDLPPEDIARYGYVWVIVFGGTWTGEGVAPQAPPEFHKMTFTIDAESGEVIGWSGSN